MDKSTCRYITERKVIAVNLHNELFMQKNSIQHRLFGPKKENKHEQLHVIFFQI
jgi:hypothetical protein